MLRFQLVLPRATKYMSIHNAKCHVCVKDLMAVSTLSAMRAKTQVIFDFVYTLGILNYVIYMKQK